MAGVPAGLCTTCRHHRIIATRKGSTFTMCGRSRTDPRFDRYPRLPVITCTGYEDGPPDTTASNHPNEENPQ